MALYDRDYARGGAFAYESSQRSEAKIVSFVKQTYKLFAASLMAAAVGAYVGIPMAASLVGLHWPLYSIRTTSSILTKPWPLTCHHFLPKRLSPN